MNKVLLLVCLLVQVVFPQTNYDFVLKPCEGNEILNAGTSEADLLKIFGKRNSERVERWYAEGTVKVIGTVFFSDSPREFFIKWKDTVDFKYPEWIEIHGDSSIWELSNGIKIGVNIEQLVKLNKKQFTFLGFDWDYGGIVNFEKGKLDSGCYSVRLYYDFEKLTEPQWQKIVGDKTIITSSQDLRDINIYVDQITVMFK